MQRPVFLLATCLLTSALSCGSSQHTETSSRSPSPSASPSQEFDRLARAYFDARFRFVPTEGTSTGVHTYDSAIEDLTPDGIRQYGVWLDQQHALFEHLAPQLPETVEGARAPSSDHPRLDAELLRDSIALESLRLIQWNELATHPSVFHQLAADTVYQLMVRDFASVDVRVRNATARLRAIPAMLTAAEHWATNPSRLAVDVALREITGSIEMIRDIFPRFADRSTVVSDRAAAREAATLATTSLVHYRDFLQNTLLPHATGDYHDGRAHWVIRAQLSDGITETPESIRDASLAEVRRLQADMAVISQRLAHRGENLATVLARLRNDHPTAPQLLDAYRSRQNEVRAFVRDHEIATIDAARDNLEIQETPGFLRATVFAALSAPGPLEQVDRRTLFYVTPADMTRPQSEIDAYLTDHSTGAIAITSVHEAYPGHHVQGIHQRQANSLVRQILWQGTYGEGWAHYCEQMMVDQGFGDDSIRLDQRQEALLRAARAYLDVGIHVFGMSYEDAVRFYRDEAFMSQPGAEMEARRVALGPASVFVYTYGKFAISRLRRAVTSGPHPQTLAQFHNALLDFGSAPLPRVARALYGIELGPWTAGETP